MIAVVTLFVVVMLFLAAFSFTVFYFVNHRVMGTPISIPMGIHMGTPMDKPICPTGFATVAPDQTSTGIPFTTLAPSHASTQKMGQR